MMGGIIVNGPANGQNGKPLARESLADVIVRASGGKAQKVFSDFMISPDNGSISIRFIGIRVRWGRSKGFEELNPDGTPDERAVNPQVVVAFKKLLVQDAKTDEKLGAFVEANPELKV